jgi:FkbM family methyltransferase
MGALTNVYGDTSGLIRTGHLRAVGGYDVRRGTAGDRHLYIKLVGAGYRVEVRPEYLLYYRVRDDSTSRTGNSCIGQRRILEEYVRAQLSQPERWALWTAFISSYQSCERENLYLHLCDMINQMRCIRHRLANRMNALLKRVPLVHPVCKGLALAGVAALKSLRKNKKEQPRAVQPAPLRRVQPAQESAVMQAREYAVTIANRQVLIRCPATQTLDYIIEDIFVRRVYPFLPFLQVRDRAIVDIGAHVGCASVVFRVLYPAATVFAFEPCRETYGFLESNVARLGNVRTFNFGLWDRNGTARLYKGTCSSASNSLGSSVRTTKEYEEVQVRSASAVFAQQDIGQVAILKIDAEGAEVPILRDLASHLGRIDSLFIEFHSEKDRRAIDALLSDGFQLYNSAIDMPHRGVLIYVARDVIASMTDQNRYEISISAGRSEQDVTAA